MDGSSDEPEGFHLQNAQKRRKPDKYHDGHGEFYHASTSNSHGYDDYTVGWICAIPLEMTAAKAMLDDIHPSLPNSLNDHNTYTLGRMGNHMIAVACMPSGIYGTTSATTVAQQMMSTFKSIRFGLMVGIGGGVPSQHADIRLGDVVVSKPTGVFSGVVQYDYGKTIQEGKFERIGMLNKPPQVLLTAIAQLLADYKLRPSRIQEYLSEMVERYPLMAPKFVYCGERQDKLFDSYYEHSKLEETCEYCDPNRIVIRPERLIKCPEVHYGLIASGNQVIKHGETRDKWARELGILCFEMEAAGLMDHFPCLVIRGVCDYADSHKNKDWQEYAAATAAAYGKEILSVIPGIEKSNGTTIAKERPLRDEEQRRVLLDSLRFNQIDARQMTIKLAHTKTCRWLLSRSEYLD